MTNINDKLINYIDAQQKVQNSTSNIMGKIYDIINVHSTKIKEQNKTIRFLLYIQAATLIVIGLVHTTHSGWFDNIGWLQ